MTLTGFLLARIAEDEAHVDAGWLEDPPFGRIRMLAECEAKRRIVEHHAEAEEFAASPCMTLRYLALSYADHPDYRDEWKP